LTHCFLHKDAIEWEGRFIHAFLLLRPQRNGNAIKEQKHEGAEKSLACS